jgi:hypothetical protein
MPTGCGRADAHGALAAAYLGCGMKANSGWRSGRETVLRECSLERRERKAQAIMFI